VFWASGTADYPLAFLLLRWLLAADLLPSTGEGWLRLPFAFFGILSVPVLAVFGRTLVGRRAALLAALLLALFPWHLYWSQNARGYALTMLFCMLGMFAFHGGVTHRSIPWALLGLVLVAAGGLAHGSGFLLMAALLVYLTIAVWREPALRQRILRPAVVAVLCAMVVVASIWAMPALLRAMEKKPDSSLLHLAKTFAWFVGPPMFVAAAAGLIWLWRSGREHAASLLAAWLGVPLILLVVLGSTVTKVTAQYGLTLLPAFCLAAAWFLVALHDAIPVRHGLAWVVRWAPALLLLGNLAAYDALYFGFHYGERPRWREAADLVRVRSKGPVLVVTTAVPCIEYYLDRSRFRGQMPRPDIEVVGVSWEMRDAGWGEKYFAALEERAAVEGRDLWIIVTEPELAELDQGGLFDRTVRRSAHQVARFPTWTGPKDMTVLVYRRD
jgi:4-amino-4-deoxy-L-arabinose transferase-like glycosyltransferase